MARDFFNGAPITIAPNNNGVSVTSGASVQILAQNNDRKGAVLCNNGAAIVWLSFGKDAVAVVGKGFPMQPNGGICQIDANFLWQGAIQGISAGATGTVGVVEV